MLRLALLACCGGLWLTGTSMGGIHLLAGPGTLVINPASMFYTADAYESPPPFFWTERTNHTLTADLVVSILPPVTFPNLSIAHSNDNSLTIANGTIVDSYYIHFDPVGGTTVATFSFDAPILGLVTNARDSAPNDHFMMSDYLIDPAVPGANLPAGHYDLRGIEPSINSDFIRWLNPFTIEVHLGASSPGDQIRIVTAFEPVPEPSAVLALGLASLGLVAVRKKRRRFAR